MILENDVRIVITDCLVPVSIYSRMYEKRLIRQFDVSCDAGFNCNIRKTQIFRLEELNGTITGGGSAFLRWRFLPVEKREYVLKVTVRTEERFENHSEEQPIEITLRGTGYDPRTRDPHR